MKWESSRQVTKAVRTLLHNSNSYLVIQYELLYILKKFYHGRAKYYILVLRKEEHQGFSVQLGHDILELCNWVWLFTISLKCSLGE